LNTLPCGRADHSAYSLKALDPDGRLEKQTQIQEAVHRRERSIRLRPPLFPRLTHLGRLLTIRTGRTLVGFLGSGTESEFTTRLFAVGLVPHGSRDVNIASGRDTANRRDQGARETLDANR
jgi:hypothetical protein